MITGPLPMISTDFGLVMPRSAATGHEAVEHLERVERTGRAFGVVLHGLDRLRRVAQALDRAVVQVALADDEAAVGGAASRRRPRPRGSGPSPARGRTRRPCTGWFAPWWPKRRRRVSAPAARPTIWWPRQMPSSGRPSSIAACARRTGPSSRDGSPGPGDRTRPRISGASAVRASTVCGSTRTRAPRATQLTNDVLLQAEVDDADERPVRRPDLVRRLDRHLADEVLLLPARRRVARLPPPRPRRSLPGAEM